MSCEYDYGVAACLFCPSIRRIVGEVRIMVSNRRTDVHPFSGSVFLSVDKGDSRKRFLSRQNVNLIFSAGSAQHKRDVL